MFFVGVILCNFLDMRSCALRSCSKNIFYIFCGVILFTLSHKLNLFGEWLLFNLVILLPLFLFLITEDKLDRLLDNGFVNYLGNISYDIYLWNSPYFMFIKILIDSDILSFSSAKLGYYLAVYLGLLLLSAISNKLRNFLSVFYAHRAKGETFL